MRAGILRNVIEVQEAIESKNSVGEVEKLWAYRGKLRGDIKSIGGRERFNLNQAKPVHDVVIITRGNAAPYLTTKMRLKHDDHIYDIEAIGHIDGRNIVKEIYCKEQAA
jgi:SPP1 family predicted phage head-tail adaptor